LEIDGVLTVMATVGAPPVAPVRPMSGGAVGAWEVVRQSGAASVLTWRGPRAGRDGRADVNLTAELVAIARRAGIPAPRYEDVVPLPDGGVVVLQEFVPGVHATATTEVITSLLKFAERRRGLLRATGLADHGTPLYLTGDGPGFCLHGPLRDRDGRTRRLLDWIEAVGHANGDIVAGDDLVHFDYHLGNVLSDAHDASRVLAILDWDGAGCGDVGIDGVILALDLVPSRRRSAAYRSDRRSSCANNIRRRTPLLLGPRTFEARRLEIASLSRRRPPMAAAGTEAREDLTRARPASRAMRNLQLCAKGLPPHTAGRVAGWSAEGAELSDGGDDGGGT